MWQDSGFARPVSSFEAPVHPPGADPTVGPFAYVAVNKLWMPFVLGALQQLLLQSTWDTDNPDVLNLAQEQAFNLIQQFQVANEDCPAGSQPTVISEMGVDLSVCEQLRFHNGKLQGLCCGEWTDIPGQTPGEGIGAPGQPGDGQPQPTPNGGCETYHAVMAGNSGWTLPTGVSAGDTVTVQNATGATYDGGYSPWNCWDGNSFFLGFCIPHTGGPSGGDPAPTIKHMHLVCEIAGVWYNTDTPITVPGGVANAPVNFQVNDSNLADNGGSLAFDVLTCNNQASDWCYHFDFTTSTQGFSIFVPGSQDSGSCGSWTAGVGFVYDTSHQITPEYFRRAWIQRTAITPFELTEARLTFDLVKGPFNTAGDYGAAVFAVVAGTPTAVVSVLNPALVNGVGQSLDASVDVPATDQLQALIQCSSSQPGDTTSGSTTITGLTIYGKGICPFGTPNC